MKVKFKVTIENEIGCTKEDIEDSLFVTYWFLNTFFELPYIPTKEMSVNLEAFYNAHIPMKMGWTEIDCVMIHPDHLEIQCYKYIP